MSFGPLARSWSVACAFVLAGTACGGSSGGGGESVLPPPDSNLAFPMFEDANGNGLNDFVEAATHDPGSPGTAARVAESAGPNHGFLDADADGVCDFSQDGSSTWHGPGFVDEDADGVCDYWDADAPRFEMDGGGMQYQDRDGNHLNDFMEAGNHEADGHIFTDLDGDGVCDFAQDGSAGGWHGPGFVDEDRDGICDVWQEGGRGHGHPGGGPHHGGAGQAGPE